MNITSAQKDAIKRKVSSLVQNRSNEIREKAKKEYVVPKSFLPTLTKLSRLEELQKEFNSIVEELCSRSSMYGIDVTVGGKSYCLSKSNGKFARELIDILSNDYANEAVCAAKLPNMQEISDDIELQTLDKNFDLKAFVDKWEAIINK